METDQQVLSALEAAQRAGEDETGLFAFYERLLRLLHAQKGALPPLDPSSLQADIAAFQPESATPALSWSTLALEAETFHPWLLQVAALFDERDPGALDEVEAVTPTESLNHAEAWFRQGATLLGPTVDALFANALAPHLEHAAAQLLPLLPLTEWEQPYCPLCGGYPDFALWQERPPRTDLLCERCGVRWQSRQAGCLFCGEAEPEAVGYYSSDDDVYRVQVCDSCGLYLKGMSHEAGARAGLAPVLAAERLLTPGLDLLAAQEGYTRPAGKFVFGA